MCWFIDMYNCVNESIIKLSLFFVIVCKLLFLSLNYFGGLR